MMRLVILLIYLPICSYFDIKYRKIPNIVTMICLLAGLGINFILNDSNPSFYESLFGAALPFILLFPFFLLRAFGAGDIKEFMAIGALTGYKFTINSFVFIAFVALIMVVFKFIKYKNFRLRMGYFFRYLKKSFYLREFAEYDEKYEKEGNIPFSIAIFLGVCTNLYMQSIGVFVLI